MSKTQFGQTLYGLAESGENPSKKLLMTIFSHAHFKKTAGLLYYKTKLTTWLANVRVQDNANNYLVSIRSLPTATLRVRVGYNPNQTSIAGPEKKSKMKG